MVRRSRMKDSGVLCVFCMGKRGLALVAESP